MPGKHNINPMISMMEGADDTSVVVYYRPVVNTVDVAFDKAIAVGEATGFWGKIVGFFHSILYFFAHLFGLR